MAALRGQPIDDCQYRRVDKKNAWVRGWHFGHNQLDRRPLSTSEKAIGKQKINHLRSLLNKYV